MKIFITALLMLSSFFTYSQYDSKGEDEISRFRPGTFWFYTGIRPGKENKVRKYDRLIFDILYNDWVGDLKPFKVKPSSIGFAANLLFDVPLSKGNTIAFGWGINYTFSHTQHNNTFLSDFKENSTKYITSQTNSRNSFNYNQFSIPVELRFRNESWKHLKIHIGGKIGYIARAYEKTTLKDPSGKTVIKDFHFSDLNPIQYATHIRFGLRNYSIFGEYNFAPLFANMQSTKLNIFRLGLSISLF